MSGRKIIDDVCMRAYVCVCVCMCVCVCVCVCFVCLCDCVMGVNADMSNDDKEHEIKTMAPE